jgi:transposase
MSSRPRRLFGREFKLQIVRQLTSGEKRLGQLCREHNLAESLVARWREQYERDGETAWLEQPTHVERDPERRIAELEAALGRAHLELELLRRALQKGGLRPERNGR